MIVYSFRISLSCIYTSTKFTKLSADSEGMYFKIHMNGLQPERYYRILFKHTNNEGTEVYDDNYHFKVVR